MQRDVIMTETVKRGALARELFAAEAAKLRAEAQLEQMLDSLYGKDGWTDFEYGEGTLDVYSVLASEAAVHALHRAGFRLLRQHEHERRRFSTCACRLHRDPLGGA